ncbi:MAG: 3-oxoacyl-[acyl-carrier-protein] reductase [Candidatus Schekmanbacteria bacterium RIFCSPLOWO2_12_FULL_38_15]|uniref:3-oxoacyl-[acyl-carrier-protein] reductase n=1 Tax=Candidatus Schekmanbacteria bacterium RIFCSPLOWO2_12_FULL_38_15 TaxID=1817883 RepID=A0A1F7SK48_9BACT|nr:MAG: 3-oxoacyl-[acyl-carrier-protein] reductase [Candidatus Schekmanbacteria bacterium RIFCSPLOWO2_12_FULL_38_15]
MEKFLEGKVAIVTGGSRGIGKSISKNLAEAGAIVIINYSSNEAAAQQTLQEILEKGGKGEIKKARVENYEEISALVDGISERYQKIDILVNNAGITRDNLVLRMDWKEWDEVLNVNLKGTFFCTKAVMKSMIKARYGKIVNITSIVGVTGNAGQTNYCASKAGIIGFTKSVARELASRNINVNAVAPGFIETDMTDGLPEKAKEEMKKQIPFRRFGLPDDIAHLVNFLVSDKASYITGQVIHVNGGMYM